MNHAGAIDDALTNLDLAIADARADLAKAGGETTLRAGPYLSALESLEAFAPQFRQVAVEHAALVKGWRSLMTGVGEVRADLNKLAGGAAEPPIDSAAVILALQERLAKYEAAA
jgi:chemotaxis regulatin CheY-phosphate phosphatase CheZ